MIETADETTLQLAVLIGAMALASGIGGWRHPELWERMFDEFDRSPGLTFSIALAAVLFGGIVLLLPGGWTDPLAMVVSGIGLLSLVEGLILLAVPEFYLGLVRPLLRYARAWAVFATALGVLLVLVGMQGLV